MSHDYCQDPKCQAGAHEVDWTAGSQERSAQPGRDATIRRNCMPVADGTSEREHKALELRNIYRCTPPAPLEKADNLADPEGKIWLAIYDHAEAIFGERVEDYKRALDSLNEGNAYLEKSRDEAQDEVERLKARVDELDELVERLMEIVRRARAERTGVAK